MVHRIAMIACAAFLGMTPAVAAAAPPAMAAPASPTPTPAQTVPFRPCPMTEAAQAVAVPQSTLPAPQPRDPARPVVGGNGLATAGLTVPADAPALPTNLAARSWLVADVGSGAVLGACGPHEQRAPASVQKLLLAATVLPRLDPNQVVTVTNEDVDIEPGSSAVGLVTGGNYPVQTLWLGLLLVSGNDAANTLARLGGGAGGVPATMQAMNDLAYRIGARDTHAVTPHGLDAPGQFTSAYDLALIAKTVLAREDFRQYDATRSAQIPAQPPKDPRGFQIQNDNQLIYQYQGALGGKTGFTDVARHTYVGFAERNGRRLVVTLLGAETVTQRTWQQGAALLDWGFAVTGRSNVGRLVEPGELDASAGARGGKNRKGQDAATGGGSAASSNDSAFDLLVSIGAALVIIAAVFVLTLRRRRRVRRRRDASEPHQVRRPPGSRRPDPGGRRMSSERLAGNRQSLGNPRARAEARYDATRQHGGGLLRPGMRQRGEFGRSSPLGRENDR